MDLHGIERDLKQGTHVHPEDLAVAALVMAPFVLTFVIIVGWLTWMPSLVLILMAIVLQIGATFWNAGWRARTAA